MGMRKISSSRFDREPCRCAGCQSEDNKAAKLPNPDPKNCRIVNHLVISDDAGDKRYLVVRVEYPDCTTFEGKKILVYEGDVLHALYEQIETVGLDPHFSEDKRYHSPIARFLPTGAGWRMATTFCDGMLGQL